MQFLLLFHCDSVHANARRCYVCRDIAFLVYKGKVVQYKDNIFMNKHLCSRRVELEVLPELLVIKRNQIRV
jgi:hypothetical protein